MPPTIIDVRINRLDGGRVVGDIEFGTANERASAITPAPWGVDPMTIAMLLGNAVKSAIRTADVEAGGAK